LTATLTNSGVLYKNTGQPQRAEERFLEVLEICGRLRDHFPEKGYEGRLGAAHQNLGNVYSELNRYEDAVHEYKQALEYFEEIQYLDGMAMVQNNLGIIYRHTGRLPLAEEMQEAALESRRRILVEQPDNPEYQNNVAASLNNLAYVYMDAGKLAEAEEALVEAERIRRKLAMEHPDRPEFEWGLTGVQGKLAEVYSETGRPDRAVDLYRQTIADFQSLVERRPEVPQFQFSLADRHLDLASFFAEHGQRLEESHESLENAIVVLEKLTADFPDASRYREVYAEAHLRLGDNRYYLEKRDEAKPAYEKAIQLWQQLAKENPDPGTEYQERLGTTHLMLGQVANGQGNVENALEMFDQAISILEAITSENRRFERARVLLDDAHRQRAEVLKKLGRTEKK
jgi:tetratricopeptide (TPR) repeat protein